LLLLLMLQVHLQIPKDGMFDLVLLTLNCSGGYSHRFADAVASGIGYTHLAAQLEPSQARKLLITAAVRQHEHAVLHMLELDTVQQHVDSGTLVSLIKHMITSVKGIDALSALPAAADIDSDAVIELLHEAVQQGTIEVAAALCELPAAQHLTSAAVLQLLASVEHYSGLPYDSCVDALCSLPAAAKLSSDDIGSLMLRALDLEDPASIRSTVDQLSDLYAGCSISEDIVAQLLDKAARHTCVHAVNLLQGLYPVKITLHNPAVVAGLL
jgi:hypothetical protein